MTDCRWYQIITRTGTTVRVWARDIYEAREIANQKLTRDWHSYRRDEEPTDEMARRLA